MIIVPTTEIKKFLFLAKSIKDNNILPVLSCIKLDCNKEGIILYKNNLQSFVVYSSEKGNSKIPMSVLLDTKSLSAFVASTQSEIITFSVNERKEENVIKITVTMDDGTTVFSFKSFPVSDYPKGAAFNFKDALTLDEEVLSAVCRAKNYTSRNDFTHPFARNVYIRPIGKVVSVFATDGFLLYHKELKQKLPEICLTPNEQSVIGDMQEVLFSTNDKYHVFKDNDVIYGFITTEDKPIDPRNLVRAFVDENPFTVSKEDITSYCNFINSAVNRPNPICSIKDGGDILQLSFKDDAYGKLSNKGLRVVGGKKGEFIDFHFRPAQMLSLLSVIQGDLVTLYNIDKGTVYVKDPTDEKYLGIIRGLIYE